MKDFIYTYEPEIHQVIKAEEGSPTRVTFHTLPDSQSPEAALEVVRALNRGEVTIPEAYEAGVLTGTPMVAYSHGLFSFPTGCEL
jgi:hypothetical protein